MSPVIYRLMLSILQSQVNSDVINRNKMEGLNMYM